MRKELKSKMQTIFVADKSLTELECLFACDIENDDDFYDVLAYNISQLDPDYFIERVRFYPVPRLRGAVFGLGSSPKRDHRQQATLVSLLTHSDPLIVAEAIDAITRSGHTSSWSTVMPLLGHQSPYVRGAVARFATVALPSDQAFNFLINLLEDKHPIVKQNAIDELSQLGNLRAISYIRPYLDDPDEDVQQAAQTAINVLSR